MKKILVAGLAVGFLTVGMVEVASATLYTGDVEAKLNSSTNGIGLDLNINLSFDQLFTVSTGFGDLWSSGPLPRVSDADGLIKNLYATSDLLNMLPPGTNVGDLIGRNWGLYSDAQKGFSAPYGSLVGEIDGSYALLGKSFTGKAWKTGKLNLYYWDSNNYDNSGTVAVTVNDNPNPVPEPATMLLFGTGLVGLAGIGRRKKS